MRDAQRDTDRRAELFADWSADYTWLAGRLLTEPVPDLENAFRVSEQRRARVLLETMDAPATAPASPALADVRVRQGLLHGLDRQAISDRLFDGRQPVADTSVHPLDWVHTDDVHHYGYDPARAAELLDEAGWRPGAGGLRRNADGMPLRIELMTTAGNRTRELVQQVAQGQWRQLGIETVIRFQRSVGTARRISLRASASRAWVIRQIA